MGGINQILTVVKLPTPMIKDSPSAMASGRASEICYNIVHTKHDNIVIS